MAAAAVISNIAGASSASLPASLSLASYPCPEAIDLHGSSGASRASCGSFDSACRDSIDGLASLDPNTLVTLSNLAAAAAAAESNGFCSLNTLATAALAVANAQNHQITSEPRTGGGRTLAVRTRGLCLLTLKLYASGSLYSPFVLQAVGSHLLAGQVAIRQNLLIA
ncbi:unnamed protein product [Protopolystoma xenopodis]|uniref:Uncharacterized protein n=1 Tax=Protopolystoma xenopodis TaxID=117903 RepID=A0A3S5A6N5_9PLAT|nr:unnamed protein product [Protopolystoma xenopodis]